MLIQRLQIKLHENETLFRVCNCRDLIGFGRKTGLTGRGRVAKEALFETVRLSPVVHRRWIGHFGDYRRCIVILTTTAPVRLHGPHSVERVASQIDWSSAICFKITKYWLIDFDFASAFPTDRLNVAIREKSEQRQHSYENRIASKLWRIVCASRNICMIVREAPVCQLWSSAFIVWSNDT